MKFRVGKCERLKEAIKTHLHQRFNISILTSTTKTIQTITVNSGLKNCLLIKMKIRLTKHFLKMNSTSTTLTSNILTQNVFQVITKNLQMKKFEISRNKSKTSIKGKNAKIWRHKFRKIRINFKAK